MGRWQRVGGRTGLAALGVVALLGLVAPGLMGYLLEPGHRQALERLPAPLRPESSEYQRGWFGSRAAWILATPAGGPRLKLDIEITHGPLLLAGILRPGPLVGMGTLRGRLALGDPSPGLAAPLAMGQGWVSADGRLQMEWWGLAPGPAGGRDWARIEGAVHQGWELQAQLAALPIGPAATGLRLRDIKLQARFESAADVWVLGELTASVGRLGQADASRGLAAEGLRLHATREGADADHGLWRLAAERLRLGGAAWGPAGLELRPSGLAADWWRGPDPATQTTWLDRLAGLRLQVPALRLVGERGALLVALSLSVRAPDAPSGVGLADWLAAIDGQANVTVGRELLREELERLTRQRLARAPAPKTSQGGPRPLLREDIDERAAVQTSRQLALFVNQGYLRRTDGGFRTRLELRDGELRLNGKTVTLAQIVPQ